jgi:hypothetical protein
VLQHLYLPWLWKLFLPLGARHGGRDGRLHCYCGWEKGRGEMTVTMDGWMDAVYMYVSREEEEEGEGEEGTEEEEGRDAGSGSGKVGGWR